MYTPATVAVGVMGLRFEHIVEEPYLAEELTVYEIKLSKLFTTCTHRVCQLLMSVMYMYTLYSA